MAGLNGDMPCLPSTNHKNKKSVKDY